MEEPPGAIGQRRNTEIDGVEFLGRAQGYHPRISVPWTFQPGRIFVDDQDVGHTLAQQAKGCGQAALPAADDDDVMDMPVRMGARTGPVGAAMADQHELPGQLGFQRGQAHAISSSRSRTISPIWASAVAISSSRPWLSRCSMAANIPALSVSRTQMMKGKSKRSR